MPHLCQGLANLWWLWCCVFQPLNCEGGNTSYRQHGLLQHPFAPVSSWGYHLFHMQKVVDRPARFTGSLAWWSSALANFAGTYIANVAQCCTIASQCTRHSVRCLKPVQDRCHNTNMAGLQHIQLLRSSNSVQEMSRLKVFSHVNKAAGCVSLPKVTSNLGGRCSSPRCPIPQKISSHSMALLDAFCTG